MTDANELEEGLLIKRRKGSRDNITLWSPLLRELWDKAKAKRNAILQDKKQPHPLDPAKRFIFISEFTGDKITGSSLKTAKSRVDKMAVEQAQKDGINYVPFTLHDVKRAAITNSAGTTADKMEASGHRSLSMMKIYDVSKPKVKPTSDK